METGLLRRLVDEVREGRPIALVTVVETKGSVPRHVGSAMLQLADGSIVGTVGGGRGEAAARDAALAAIGSAVSTVIDIEMLGEATLGTDMICGGTSRMLVEAVGTAAAYEGVLAALDRGERSLLVRSLPAQDAPALPERAVFAFDEKLLPRAPSTSPALDADLAARCLQSGRAALSPDGKFYYDAVLPDEKLLILGGGHVGAALARLGQGLGFKVTVGDDRAEYLAAGRFPEGTATASGDYAAIIGGFPFDSSTYVVVATRGHLFDLDCVRAALPRSWRYLGLIGSSRKTRMILEQLAVDGADPFRIAALRAPIGMDIGAETPEEIAVAILAELVAVRRSGAALASLDRDRAARRLARG